MFIISQLGAQRFDCFNWREAAQLFGDMATAEQRPDIPTSSACKVTVNAIDLVSCCLQLGAQRFDGGNWREAAQLFGDMATAEQCPDFLTLPAYDAICRKDTVTSRM